MSIYARCCKKDYAKNLRKCTTCHKTFTKFMVKIKNPHTGKWKSKTVNSLKLAKEVEAKMTTQQVEGNLFDKKKSGEINFDLYIEHAKIHKKSWKNDLSRWNRLVKTCDYKSRHGIVKILSKMKTDGYAPCTVHHMLKLIKRVYNWHIENELYFQPNPCNSIKPPIYDNKVTNYLDHPDIKHLKEHLQSWSNERATRVILFALYTGRRKGEVLRLLWNDVDMDARTITCRETKNGKTLSFPLNNLAFEIIIKAHKDKISEYVFPSSSGHHYYNGFSLAWKRLKKRVGLNYRFHDLRHTYASHLASSGKVDIYTLKNLLGHQDVALTMRYAHLTNEAVKQATCVMDDLF